MFSGVYTATTVSVEIRVEARKPEWSDTAPDPSFVLAARLLVYTVMNDSNLI